MRNFFEDFSKYKTWLYYSQWLFTFLVYALPLSIINTIRSSLMVINLKDNKNEMEQKNFNCKGQVVLF